MSQGLRVTGALWPARSEERSQGKGDSVPQTRAPLPGSSGSESQTPLSVAREPTELSLRFHETPPYLVFPSRVCLHFSLLETLQHCRVATCVEVSPSSCRGFQPPFPHLIKSTWMPVFKEVSTACPAQQLKAAALQSSEARRPRTPADGQSPEAGALRGRGLTAESGCRFTG